MPIRPPIMSRDHLPRLTVPLAVISSFSTMLIGSALLLGPSPAQAVLPLPTYPECGKDSTLKSCPPDMSRADGSSRGTTWELVSFILPEVKKQVRAEEQRLGSGNGQDVAFRYSTGRFDVTIAVLDSGIIWEAWEIINKIKLNENELPRPQKADGTTCSADDCNGDGLFNIQDFAGDARVKKEAGIDTADSVLDASDLIATFSDNKDDDSNGYIDDISGWDFLWDDNQAYASNRFDHGTGVMEHIGAEGGQTDTDIGNCPNCSILPVRTGDSFIADADRLAQGILYATDRGAKVIAMASGTINNTATLHEALQYAWSKGVLVVAAIGDELSYHHLYPGAADYLMAVHSIRYWPPIEWENAKTYLAFNGCNNFGSHLTVVSGTTSCATGATGITAGTAGLIFSRYRDLGIELHPDEVRAMLINSATDINVPGSGQKPSVYFPSHAGWDIYFGYGRLHAGRAIEQGVPPQVHLTGPRWYEYLDAATTSNITVKGRMASPRASSYTWKLEWAPGGDTLDTDFVLLATGNETALKEGTIFTWPISSIPRDRLDPAQQVEQVTMDDTVSEKLVKVNVHTINLRLSVTDDSGRRSEMRKSFFLHYDDELKPGFPKNLGASGQASPVLFDVDSDGIDDLLSATASGMVYVFDGLTRQPLPGWPVQMPYTKTVDPSNPRNHTKAQAYVTGGVKPPRQGVLSSMNAGDLDNDGAVEVIAATMDGYLYVYSYDGKLRPGFPVTRDPVSEADTNELVWLDPGMISSPYVVDLDLDGNLEIIQAAMDQKVYVWREDGTRQAGFPVKLEFDGSSKNIKGRIVSSPEVGLINNDSIPDIVIGANEYNPELYVPGYAYAISGRGNLEPGGAVLQGWPVVVMGAINGVVPFIGDGATATPIMADVDGDGRVEISISGTVSCPHLYEHTGARTLTYDCSNAGWTDPSTIENIAVAFLSNPIFADLEGDGRMEIMAALSGVHYAIALGASTWMNQQDHLIGAWDAETGEMLPGWPVVMDDLALFMRPAAADVDGDGILEVIASSGGYLVHAYDVNGQDVPGWPKLTGGMISNALEAGDFDGDGLNEVVAYTHEGYLFVWETKGLAM